MLHRHDEMGLTVITQPAHAWISGQLAAAWGNAPQGLSTAGLELRLAAEQHDIAWLDWERSPTLNPERGLPYAFNELPTLDHLRIWAQATGRALAYGRLPAVLVSMHGAYLYRRFHDFDADSSPDAEAARAFLRQEEELQANIIRSLEAGGDISQSDINQQRILLSLWDAMSLALCMGFSGARTFEGVPTDDNAIAITVEHDDARGVFSVEPWPFRNSRLRLQCEGKRLPGTYTDQDALWAALRTAEPVNLEFDLAPVAGQA